jgi:hypothetical protein
MPGTSRQWTAMYNNSIYWGKTYLAYLTYNIVHNTKRALLLRTPPGQYHAGVILASIVTGLAGLECAFFLMTLAVFSINLHNHRKAGIQRCMASWTTNWHDGCDHGSSRGARDGWALRRNGPTLTINWGSQREMGIRRRVSTVICKLRLHRVRRRMRESRVSSSGREN